MFLHNQTYRFEFNKFYLYIQSLRYVLLVSRIISYRARGYWGRGVADPQRQVRSVYRQPICIFPAPLGENKVSPRKLCSVMIFRLGGNQSVR